MSRDFPKGKIMKKNEIDEMLSKAEEEFRHKQRTANEERKHIEEMQKMKQLVPLVKDLEELRKSKEAVYKQIDAFKAENKAEFEKIQDIVPKIEELESKLNLKPKEPEEKKAEEEKDKVVEVEKEKERKKKRELTEQEVEIESQREKIKQEIRLLKEQQEKMYEELDAEYYKYQEQQFELQKIEAMEKHQQWLRR
jgi:hypothetical protein